MTRGALALPCPGRGRRTAEAEEAYQAQLDDFASEIKALVETIGRRVSIRGLCYLLEEHGLAKGDFGKAQDRINLLRKDGRLPLDIVLEDDAREVHGLYDTDASWGDRDPERWARVHYDQAKSTIASAMEHARANTEMFRPVPWHEGLRYRCFLLVEKIDLVALFRDQCRNYRVPIANQRGWADLLLKAKIADYFAKGEELGQIPVLLYCGDHDPAGLLISDTLRDNLEDMAGATGWHVDHLVIDRFGLNADFIQAHGLSWIDGLQTSSGRDMGAADHPMANANHVRNYIARFGRRKVEANALVTRPAAARQLVQEAINRYIPKDWVATHVNRNLPLARQAVEAFDRLVAEGR